MILLGLILRSIRIVLGLFVHIPRILWAKLLRKDLDAWLEKEMVLWAQAVIRIYKGELNIRGQDHLDSIDWSQNVFFISNHSSYMDIPTLIAAANHKVGFIAKKELKTIPFLGYWMNKVGCLFVDRKNTKSLVRDLVELQKSKDPSHLVLFPSGTRIKDGSLGRFKKGGLKMFWHIKPIIVPVCIKGARETVEDCKSLLNKKTVDVEFLKPMVLNDVKSEQIEDFDDWMKDLQNKMANILEVR
jgi:DNA helicase II / ATP-dependent DNA helicase PcrA